MHVIRKITKSPIVGVFFDQGHTPFSIHMNTPRPTFDTNFAKRVGINETLLSDNELNDIVTIAQTLDAFGEDQNLRIFFEQQKSIFCSAHEYMKAAQVRNIEHVICKR